MLDSETRRRIDNLRDILVGKVPGPESQVEQITTALIYKFMYDMDQESIELGGVPSFFVGNFEKYSWHHLFNSKLSGINRVKLYSEAIESMYTNPAAPSLFREIFKNSFLPFKDPSTLYMFLKEIGEFHYSHSEKLGDAFEYLLSFMGSQGNAGQFRTPRHIIEFIVEIVAPKKNETILDPSCGTAGFLISSYKHILKQNTSKKLGDRLTAEERKKLGDNLVGYDISPDMTRISLVNMYLHQFVSPKIYEYDTLSSDDKWNEYFDVILANPPFFSPKGGITPHSRFGVQSTRAEVLFVDYIMEHLKPRGRAGIIVPEGIIFQTGTAYKTLRKKLVEDCLVGVISLPAGVFQPYSGVKTSVLILDKACATQKNEIIFIDVKKDGYTLSSSRKPVNESEIPVAKEQYFEFLESVSEEYSEQLAKIVVNKEKLNKSTYSLNSKEYVDLQEHYSNYPFYKLSRLIEECKEKYDDSRENIYSVTNHLGFIQPKNIFENRIASKDISNYKMVRKSYFAYNPSRINVGSIAYMDKDEVGQVSPMYVVFKSNTNDILDKYLQYVLKSKKGIELINLYSIGSVRNTLRFENLCNIRIPLPPIEIQREIVEELEGYEKIIDGCRQVVENYKPTIDIDPSWEIVELGEISTIISGQSPKSNFYNEIGDGLPFYQGKTDFGFTYLKETKRYTSKISRISNVGDIVMSVRAPVGPVNLTPNKVCIGRGLCAIRPNNIDDLEYLFYILQVDGIVRGHMGATYESINRATILKIGIPYPSQKEKETLTSMLKDEREIVTGNRKLIEIYSQKIQDKVSKVWGENNQTII